MNGVFVRDPYFKNSYIIEKLTKIYLKKKRGKKMRLALN